MKQLTELATAFTSVADSIVLPGEELPWLKSIRQQALEQFQQNGLPSKKVEDWKYTSLWYLSQQHFSHLVETDAIDIKQCDELALLDDAYRFVIVDGQFSESLSQLKDLPVGLTVEAFSHSVANAERVLGQQIDINKPGLNALNTLLMKEGLMVHVAANKIIEKPIELLVINTGKTEKLATHLRNMIVLDDSAEATVVEHYVGLEGTESFTNVITEVVLAERAELNHYKLQQEAENAFHIASIAAKQAEGSQWNTSNISLGAKLARNDIQSRLEGENAHVSLDGLYILNAEQHCDNHTRIDHLVANTTSNELYKGVLSDNSHGVFNGKVIVHQDAQKVDSKEYNHNLLLSRGCEIDTKPEMEIYADDVKCGHGSTVGQLDADSLFFLRARGLDETTARSLLTHAFVAEVLERISSETIRQAMSDVIEERLPRGKNE